MRKKILSSVLKGLSVVLTLCYPFVIFFALQMGVSLRFVALGLCVVFVTNFLRSAVASFSFLICGLLGIGFLYWMDNVLFFKFYPVMMNALFAFVFTISLFGGREPLVFKFAKRMGYDVSDIRAQYYVRNVTIVWSLFLCINTLVSLFTVFASDAVWVLYNGFISYVIMGCLVIGEYFVRRRIIKNVR